MTKERAVTGGGCLDMLLKNPADDAMYEVEIMLGGTDPSHIIRTIEYWDLVRRKWPKRQHFAVLVAERITKRFFNVIQILGGCVPLIAIQVNVVKSGESYLLHFTKILDVSEEPDDGVSQDAADEAYWKKQSDETLSIAQAVLKATAPIYQNARLAYCKTSINIVREGNNQLVLRPRAGGNLLVEFRYGKKRDEIAQLLEAQSIQYRDKNKHFGFYIILQRLKENMQLFAQIASLNNRWWAENGEEN
jgi:hypothetical protein